MKNKSTYSILLNADSEEKGRSILETAVYALVVVCMGLSAWSFASSEVTLPGKNRAQNPSETMIANAPAEPSPVVVASRG